MDTSKFVRKNRTGYVLYIGNYLNEAIVKERGLPTRNPAGSNRMRRIAEAIKGQGQSIAIVSPAITLRTSWQGQLLHSSRWQSAGKIPVLFCAAIGLPILGALLEPFVLLWTLQSFAAQRRIEGVILYNFNPTLVLVALWIKLFWQVPLVNNIEDISQPKLIDWLPQTEARPVQQLVFSICMTIIIRLCQGIIIPTQKFAIVIPPNKPYLIISGCMPMTTAKLENASKKTDDRPIQLLYAGKIEFEHGIQHLLETLSLISKDEKLAKKFTVYICGKGGKSEWTIDYLSKLKKLDIRYHGFVSDTEYQQLLSQADVCIALQNPQGRYGSAKTPSKVYEYLGNGKMVIATKVGDLSLLPSEVITLCDLNNQQSLYQELINIARNPQLPQIRGQAAASYAKKYFAYSEVGKKLVQFIFNLSPEKFA